MTEISTNRPWELAINTAESTAAAPLDTEAASLAADQVFALQLGTTTREEIDEWTRHLHELVSIAATVLPEGRAESRGTRWEVGQLLTSAPRDDTLVFAAFTYARDLARMLRRLVALRDEEETGTADRPRARETHSSLATRSEQARGTYVVPTGISAARSERWLNMTTRRGAS